MAGGEMPRVAFFFWEGYLGVLPSLINALRILADHGIQVDMITRSNAGGYPPPPEFGSSIRIRECVSVPPKWHRPGRDLLDALASPRRGIHRQLGHSVARLLRRSAKSVLLLCDFLAFAACAVWHTRRRRYSVLVGVDSHGLVVASLVGTLKGVPFAYWSLELKFLRDLTDPVERVLKAWERRSSRRAEFTIVQDWARADALTRENGSGPSEIVIVPNGPAGRVRVTERNYFRERLGLPTGCRVILHMGMMSDEMLSLEAAQAAATWPANWVLVFHERERRDRQDRYARMVEEAGQGRVALSLEPVGYDEVDWVVRSADIGLVLYREDLGPNFGLMARASGKCGHYLRGGLPVVGMELGGLGEIIRRHQCGQCIGGLAELHAAIDRIFERYDFYSRNAVKCYEDVYEFSGPFGEVVKRIQRLGAP